jgi:DeoR family glycerol-3-phosphate regulon repressor
MVVVTAINLDSALLDLPEEDVFASEAISRNAQTRILVLDSTKFARTAQACSGHVTEADHVA